jgi:DNA-binding NtrC family response regulator
VFEEADGGTLFLDEIGELGPAAQAALLRVLETGTFPRVGSAREIRVDVRVVAATHRDLWAMAREGRFREDLCYRLDAVTLDVPPLRERPDDIAPLAQHFLRLANAADGRAVSGIADDALAALARYSWPGNVRELRNAIDRAVVVTRSARIELADLPPAVRCGAGRLPSPAPTTLPLPRGAGAGKRSGESLRAAMRRYEAEKIVEALREAGGRRKVAAQRLGMPVRSLSHKIKTLGIRDVDDDGDEA